MTALRRAAAASIAALVLIAAGCRQEEEMEPAPKNLPTQVITNFTLTETAGADVSWKLDAKRADIYEDANEAKVFDIRVDFYEAGVYASTLTAREGRIDLLRHDMTARGNVVLVSRKDGAVLKTEELNWDPDANRIFSEAYCTLERGPSIMRGQGFTATPGLDSFSTHQLNADIREKDLQGLDTGRENGTAGAPPAGKKPAPAAPGKKNKKP